MSDESPQLDEIARRIRAARSVCAMTGAGVSAESGVPTFRGPDGLWEGRRPEDVATPAAFARDPHTVWRFYLQRRRNSLRVRPNPAHYALAELPALVRRFNLLTQNVDGLHARAGSRDVIELHGALWRDVCTKCPHTHRPDESLWDDPCGAGDSPATGDGPCGAGDSPAPNSGNSAAPQPGSCPQPTCGPGDSPVRNLGETRSDRIMAVQACQSDDIPLCGRCGAMMRPGVVWFGEALPVEAVAAAEAAAASCDVMLVIGTSGVVYPAAGFVEIAARRGATVVEVNLEHTPLSPLADVTLLSPAGAILPPLVRRLTEPRPSGSAS